MSYSDAKRKQLKRNSENSHFSINNDGEARVDSAMDIFIKQRDMLLASVAQQPSNTQKSSTSRTQRSALSEREYNNTLPSLDYDIDEMKQSSPFNLPSKKKSDIFNFQSRVSHNTTKVRHGDESGIEAEEKCRSQFEMRGSSACTYISVYMCSEFLRIGNVKAIDYTTIQNKAIFQWSRSEGGFCTVESTFQNKDVQHTTRNWVRIMEAFGVHDTMPTDESADFYEEAKNHATTLDDCINRLSGNDMRIASVITSHGASISIFQSEVTIHNKGNERLFYIFDSHGLNGSGSVLIKFNNSKSLLSYLVKWAKLERENKRGGTEYNTGFSIASFTSHNSVY